MVVARDDLPLIPPELAARAGCWGSLKRWERRELAQELRARGLSYAEIRAMVPVPKGTLSEWCRDVPLSEEQRHRLREKRPPDLVRRAAGLRRRQKTLEARDAIRATARVEAASLSADPLWSAGVAAYWSEGSKSSSGLRFANSDPGLVRLFMIWAGRYLEVEHDRFVPSLHLHDGQIESERKAFWSRETAIPVERFGKTFVKREGSGHRKKVLYNGTVSMRVRRSGRLLQVVLGWIDEAASVYAGAGFGGDLYTAPPLGR